MSSPTSKELFELLSVASLRALQARVKIATVQKAVTEIVNAKGQLHMTPDSEDPSARLAQEKWLLWRQDKLAELNRQHALARSSLELVQKEAARLIAQEEVAKLLLERELHREKRRESARLLEAQLQESTSPDAQYR